MADKVVQRLSKGQKVNDGNSFFRSPKDSLHKKPIFESNAEEFENREVLQKKCSDCNTDIKLQKQEEEEEEIQAKLSHRSQKLNGVERVQMKSTGRPDHLSGIEGRLRSAKDGGRTMAPDLQRSMGDAFGADFSSVKIHTSENAVQMNRDLSAQAFTHGRNIYFNQGKYRPETASGKHLLAHELTHTIQQGATSKSVNAKFETSHDSTLRTNGTKSPKLAGFADERENTIQKKISKVQKVPKPASRSDLPSNNGNNITRNSIRYNQNLVQSKKDLEKDKDIEEKEAAGIQAKMDNLLWDSGRDQKDEFMKGRSWEEAQSEKMILFKRDSHLQLSSNGSNDEASMRDRIVEVAKKQIGKVEARRDDGAGRRVGADRLLEYFHLAAPDQWSDAVIEQSRYTMEAKQFPHWCGIFSVYVIKKAGIDVGNWKIGTGVSQFNSLQQTDMPQKGDIGYIHEPYRHHCIIKEVNGDSITSIDGNSGTKSEVLERVRPISKYTGFFTAFTGSEKYIQKKEETADFASNTNRLEQELSSTSWKGILA